MNTSYSLNTYRAHDLNISMKTSTGDVIKMDFSNHNSTAFTQEDSANSRKTSMSFSSMQSFNFSINTNGITKEDQKEIDAFMSRAQPYIDNFLKEFEDVAPKSPVSKLAHEIASIFEPNRERSEDLKNNIKTNIVKMFDSAMEKVEEPTRLNRQEMIDKMFKEAQNLLEKTLQEFDKFNKTIYA